jgi:hypothetical protein
VSAYLACIQNTKSICLDNLYGSARVVMKHTDIISQILHRFRVRRQERVSRLHFVNNCIVIDGGNPFFGNVCSNLLDCMVV